MVGVPLKGDHLLRQHNSSTRGTHAPSHHTSVRVPQRTFLIQLPAKMLVLDYSPSAVTTSCVPPVRRHWCRWRRWTSPQSSCRLNGQLRCESDKAWLDNSECLSLTYGSDHEEEEELHPAIVRSIVRWETPLWVMVDACRNLECIYVYR